MQAVGRPYVMAGVALAGAGLVAVTPIGSPAGLPHVSDADVRLTSTDVSDLFSGLTSDLNALGLGNLTGDLSGLGLGSLTSDLSGLGLGSLDLGSLTDPGGLFADGSILNLPYNFIADIINIPYYESLALDEYAYALGPAGSTGGVPGWIPPGTPADAISSGDQYMLGGTGSWYMESMGNTWGWDNGNWPQVDALVHFLLPFQWTEGITQSIQSIAQSSFIDGTYVNCEFECGDIAGYLGGWLTHLGNIFDSTYPTTLTDTIPNFTYPDGTTIVNMGPNLGFPDSGQYAIWSGQPTINPFLAPLQAIWENSTASPASNPIMLPDIQGVFDNAVKLGQDFLNDFNPFVEGSFIYWGAPTLYSIPAVIGGLIHTATLGLVPNEFLNIGEWQQYGAEPPWGYESSPLTLLSPTEGLPAGLQYLAQGLEGYLNPATYIANLTAETSGLSTELSQLFGSAGATLPTDLLGAGSTLPADLLGSFDPSTLLGSFDPSTLLAGLDPTALTADVSTLITNAANDLGATLGSDLALNLLTSIF